MTEFIISHQKSIINFLSILLFISITNLFLLKSIKKFRFQGKLPGVSILIPARNEAENIEKCVRSLLAQKYHDYEVIVLDDDSDDGTHEVLKRLEKSDERLKIIKGKPLPEGWTGKNWACMQLFEASSKEIIVFVDADTYFDPDMIDNAVRAFKASNLDFMTVLLRWEIASFGEKITVPVVYWSFFSFFPLIIFHLFKFPALAIAFGQFIMLKRDAYIKTGGHEAVKDNTLDDIALAKKVIKVGLNWGVFEAVDFGTCRLYRSFKESINGFSKSLFGAFEYRLLPFVFAWTWIFICCAEPFILTGLSLLGKKTFFSEYLAYLALFEFFVLWAIPVLRMKYSYNILPLFPLAISAYSFIAFLSLTKTLKGSSTWKGRKIPRPKIRIL